MQRRVVLAALPPQHHRAVHYANQSLGPADELQRVLRLSLIQMVDDHYRNAVLFDQGLQWLQGFVIYVIDVAPLSASRPDALQDMP